MKKNSNNTVGVVSDLIAPLIKEQDLILWDVRFEKEGSLWLLRIIIDKKPDGVSIDDCEKLSRPVDKLLDEADPIDQSYCLEVASAGLERELTKDWHFEESIGKVIQVKLIRPYNGEREFIGKLIKYELNQITIECENDVYTFTKNETAYIKWYVEF